VWRKSTGLRPSLISQSSAGRSSAGQRRIRAESSSLRMNLFSSTRKNLNKTTNKLKTTNELKTTNKLLTLCKHCPNKAGVLNTALQYLTKTNANNDKGWLRKAEADKAGRDVQFDWSGQLIGQSDRFGVVRCRQCRSISAVLVVVGNVGRCR
jgi:hypothetical protein